MQRLIPLVTNQIQDFIESGSSDNFYLKTLLDEFIASGEELVSGSSLEEHSAKVVSAVEEFAQRGRAVSEPIKAWITRAKDKQEFRANDPLKTGRVISQANKEKVSTVRTRVSELRGMLKDMEDALSELEAMAEPKKSVESAFLNFQLEIERHRNWRTMHA
jgi:hypothetical protein